MEATLFFETLDGKLIAISRVKRVAEHDSEGRLSRWVVELDDGGEVLIGHHARRVLQYYSMASFPAAPGTVVLRAGDGRLFSYPVIGWVVPNDGKPLPVTIDGINDGQDHEDYVSVLMPDGRVYHPEAPVRSLKEFGDLHGVVDDVIVLDQATVPGLSEALANCT